MAGSSPAVLAYVGTAPVPDRLEIRLFTKCRNESLRLPAFLRHYRALGVDRFFVIDNASTDGSAEYLCEQPDVHVFRTTQSFRAARGGTDWLNEVLAHYGVGRWCVTVDVDELLAYPGSESVPLPRLTRYLDERGHEAMACLLLDLYPEKALAESTYRRGDDLVAAAPFFDRAPYRRNPHSECPYFLAYGGVRERVFYPEARAGWRRDLHVKLYHRLILATPVLRDFDVIRARRPRFPPCLTKIPLVKWDDRSHYLNVNHFVSPKLVAEETGVLLHFKLLHDFHARALDEVKRGEYYDAAAEYRRYIDELKRQPQMCLLFEGSMRFEGTQQLVCMQLMRDTHAWRATRQAPNGRFALE